MVKDEKSRYTPPFRPERVTMMITHNGLKT